MDDMLGCHLTRVGEIDKSPEADVCVQELRKNQATEFDRKWGREAG